MSTFKLSIEGLGKAEKELKRIAQKSEREIGQAFKDFGQMVATTAKLNVPVDEGRLRNSITSSYANGVVEIVVAADYAAYVEFGTRQFAAAEVAKLPPDWQTFARQFQGKGGGSFEQLVQRLTEWMRRKGYDEKNAYVAALRIMRQGVRAQPYLYPAYQQHRDELIKDLKAIFTK